MDLELADSVVTVVGAAHGVGGEIAKAFAQEQAHLALIDIDDSVKSTAQSLGTTYQVPVTAVVADVTDEMAIRNAATVISDRLGPVEHVVVAAGIGSRKFGDPFWNLSPQDWPRVIGVNLMGPVHVAHAFAPMLVAQRQGTCTFIASVAGQIGSQSDPPYSASKAALINFMQCAAKDFAQHNVRVNAISPGMVKTALNEGVWKGWNQLQPAAEKLSYEDWAAEKIEKLTPLGRWQEAADIANAALFLASPQAKNITGQTINVDGGWVMHS